MTIKEFYALAGGDAADTLRRLGSEATVRRFALRYTADGTHDALRRALAADDRPAAFRAALAIGTPPGSPLRFSR